MLGNDLRCFYMLFVRSQYDFSTLLVRSYYDFSTLLECSWYALVTFLVRSWYALGTLLVRSWYVLGTLLVRFWYAFGTLLYAFERFCTLLNAFIPFIHFYLLSMYNLSPQEEEEDRWSRVNRLYLAEAGKNGSKCLLLILKQTHQPLAEAFVFCPVVLYILRPAEGNTGTSG